jgi:hypothetical protein
MEGKKTISEAKPFFEQGNLEILNHFRLPIVILGEVPVEVGLEVEAVSLLTLRELGVDLTAYGSSIHAGDLIDLKSQDSEGRFTLLRKENTDLKIPVIIISSKPVFDATGEEQVALYEPGRSKIYINLQKIDAGFTDKVVDQGQYQLLIKSDIKDLDMPTKAAIVASEEIIHFFQDQYRQEKMEESSTLSDDIQAHGSNETEAERIILQRKVISAIYPNLV